MSQDPEGQAALLPAAPSRRPKGIDRAAAARMLAEGRSIAEAARELGCSRQNLWRQVQRSKRLARLIRSAEEEARTDAYGRLTGLGPAAVDALRRALVEDDDAGVAFKIADRMKLFERPAAADPIRGEVSGDWREFTAVLAEVAQGAMRVSRNRPHRLGPRDYELLWESAVKARAEMGAPARRDTRDRRERAASPIDEDGEDGNWGEGLDENENENDGARLTSVADQEAGD